MRYIGGILIVIMLAGCSMTDPNGKNIRLSDLNYQGVTYTGGNGSSPEQAVVIKNAPNSYAGIRAEKYYASQRFPGWSKKSQKLHRKNKKYYDVVTYQSPDGNSKIIYYDITTFFGKW